MANVLGSMTNIEEPPPVPRFGAAAKMGDLAAAADIGVREL